MRKKYNESTELSQEKLQDMERKALAKFKEAYNISYEVCSNREKCKGCMYKTWRKGKCLGEYFYRILRELNKNSKHLSEDDQDEELSQNE